MGKFVIAYCGNADNIPEGWIICDGQSGTPDLRDNFIRGAYSDSIRPVGITGGTSSHKHALEEKSFSHSHTIDSANNHTHSSGTSAGNMSMTNQVGLAYNSHAHGTTSTRDVLHTHEVNNSTVLPPFYQLLYLIQKEYKAIDLPMNSIAMWAGLIADIPRGWVLCDGQNGTPDLRDRFIWGSDGSDIGATGGTETHTHTTDSVSHTHITSSGGVEHNHNSEYSGTSYHFVHSTGGGYRTSFGGSSHVHTLNSAGSHNHVVQDSGSNIPLFYALAYIKKIA